MEHDEQKKIIDFLNLQKFKNLVEFFAIPNGGARNIITARRLKAEGVKRGISDLCLVFGSSLLFIELKRKERNKSHVSEEQRAFINKINAKTSYATAMVCYGATDAIEQIKLFAKIDTLKNAWENKRDNTLK